MRLTETVQAHLRPDRAAENYSQIQGGCLSDIFSTAIDVLSGTIKQKEPEYKTRIFQLRDIPSVMRSRLGWPVAANLMDRWFAGTAFAMPPEMKESRGIYPLNKLSAAHLEESMVRMSWALGFNRVRTAMAQLQAKWASPAGIKQLKTRVERGSSRHVGQCWRFGNLGLPAKELDDTCQVNFLLFGKMGDPMDDFYGAMGEAQIKIAASGIVTPQENGKLSVDIDELGFYLRDSYDFQDGNNFISQPLGCWGFNGVECNTSFRGSINIEDKVADINHASAAGRKYLVQNSDFQKWRAKNQRGGDFMVLSDVHRVTLPFPQKFVF
ncbi:DUF6402 family protein [Acidovorax sp. NCPPB 3576]|uniref:DUF6402 family protein n=1 Tax=Acidovorax sp. NCPPB 3576 TaxID=2940488 RepID=UPI00234A51BD|nr:DUF6402 family protein [Acidovorax sp. NCPPB 3576]WCM87209.1 DUF6402 family protein [Acidovorax sp. NCPPB 3576]